MKNLDLYKTCHGKLKKNQIFLIYKEIQRGAVAKSYMRKGLLILYMRKCANIFLYYI